MPKAGGKSHLHEQPGIRVGVPQRRPEQSLLFLMSENAIAPIIWLLELYHGKGRGGLTLIGKAIAHVPVGIEYAVHVAELVAAAEHVVAEFLDRELADALHAHRAEVGHQVQA